MPEMKRVDDLLLEWESAWRAGKALTPEELCPDSPEIQTELRRRAEMLRKFEEFSSGETTLAALTGPDAPPAIPGYTIRGELDHGGMGVVYRAWQEDLGREVAVKVMRGGPNIPPHLAKRFVQEARLLARLKHDNLVPVYEAAFNRGQPYFVMELVRGGNLADAMGRFAADPKKAAALVEQVARAVHYAHTEGVLHRDLKPSNILLDEDGRPRVSDFGLAKLFGDGSEETAEYGTEAGANGDGTLSAGCGPMGTPPYMAPEQFMGGPTAITPRTDVWALGVILYELLTGLRPFGGDYERTVCESAPRPPCSVRPKLDEGLQAIVLKCLKKDPADRYPTAAAVADELARYGRGEAPLVYPETWSRRLWRGVRRRPVVTAAVLLMAAALGLWPVAGYVMDPRHARDQIRRDLNDGKRVTLVAETGPPVNFGWGEGKGSTKVSTERDRPFFVSTHETALVELWPDPPPAFHLRAEVRHDENPAIGHVGIYFDHCGSGPSVPQPCCYVVSFSDRGHSAVMFRDPNGRAGSRVRTTFHYFPPRPGQEPHNHSQVIDDGLFYVPPAPPPRGEVWEVWRTIDIRVSPQGLDVHWMDENGKVETAAVVPQQEFVRCAGRLSRAAPEMKGYAFDPRRRAALGIYVRESAASFRNVTLERIDFDP